MEEKKSRSFFQNVIAGVVSSGILAVVSIAWAVMKGRNAINNLAWPLGLFIWVGVSYCLFLAINYFYPNGFKFKRKIGVHILFISILTISVTVPLAISFTNNFSKQRDQPPKHSEDQRAMHIYPLVSGTIAKLLSTDSLTPQLLHELLSHCINSIRIGSGAFDEVRANVVFIENENNFLVMPQLGYAGVGFDSDIERLYFNIAPQNEMENEEQYLIRLGVAGCAFINKLIIIDDDVQTLKKDEKHRYKYCESSEKDQADRAMMCIPIFNQKITTTLKNNSAINTQQCIGILSISSTKPGNFTESDLEVAKFFAVLLSHFKTPLQKPKWLTEK